MARPKKATTAKKAAADTTPTKKVIRRRNEKNEVVEIEVDDIPIEKAKVRRYEETVDKLLERRKKAQDHFDSIKGKSEKEKKTKEMINYAIHVIDKKIAAMQ